MQPLTPVVVNPWPEGDLAAKLRAAFDDYENRGRDLLNKNPMESLLALVLGGAAIYYLAERGKSEHVRHYWDAVEFTSTCASVGYSNIFPTTPVGSIVASVLFLLGPNLSSRILDPPSTENTVAPAARAGTREVASRLDAILEELRRLNNRPQ